MKIKSFLAGSCILSTLLTQPLSAFDWTGLCDPIFCDECSSYDQCTWSFSWFGGVTPTFFTCNDEDQLFFSPPAPFPFPVGVESRTFHNQYYLPGNVGAEIGYMIFDNCEIFFDFIYHWAKTQNNNEFVGPVTGNLFRLHATHYRTYDYHLGTRYYFDPFACVLTPFVGIKIGLTNRNEVLLNETVITPSGTSITYCGLPFFKEQITFSGGFQVGVNWDLACCLSMTLKADILISGDWEHHIIPAPTPNPLNLPTVLFGNTGPIVEVPITLGFRYSY